MTEARIGPVFVLAGRIGRLVRDRCLDRAVRSPVGDGLLDVGKPHIDDACAERAEYIDCLAQHLLRRHVHVVAVPGRVDADPQALARPRSAAAQIVGHRIE